MGPAVSNGPASCVVTAEGGTMGVGDEQSMWSAHLIPAPHGWGPRPRVPMMSSCGGVVGEKHREVTRLRRGRIGLLTTIGIVAMIVTLVLTALFYLAGIGVVLLFFFIPFWRFWRRGPPGPEGGEM